MATYLTKPIDMFSRAVESGPVGMVLARSLFQQLDSLQRSRYSNKAVSKTIIAYGIGELEKNLMTSSVSISYSIYGPIPLIEQSAKAKNYSCIDQNFF